MPKPTKDLPNHIRHWREERGWSQADLAESCNTSISAISDMERGVMKLSENWLRRIGDALNVPPVALLKDAGYEGPMSEQEAEMWKRYRALDEERKLQIRKMFYILAPDPSPTPEIEPFDPLKRSRKKGMT